MQDSECPIRRSGLQLRRSCEDCQGRPQSGQSTITKGSLLYLERSQSDVVYVLVEGFIRETRTLADGRTQGIRLACPGDLIGSEAFANLPYQCTAEALTDGRVCKIRCSEVEALHAEQPEQGMELTAAMGREAAGLRDAVLLVGSMTAEERVKSILDRLLTSVEPGEWLRLPLSRIELAELVGLVPETVSRCIQRFARAGHIEVSGRRIRTPPSPGPI